MKSVLAVTSIFKKSWSLWRQVWLASSLLEQILKNNFGEVPSNRPIIFFQTPTTTQPEEIRGNHGQEPQHNPAFLQNFCGKADRRGIAPLLQNGACSYSAKKITTSIWSCLQNFLIFCFNPFRFLLVIWLKIPQDFPCQMSLYC